MATTNADETFLTTAQVCARYNHSFMWIERCMKDAGFPRPTYFPGSRCRTKRDVDIAILPRVSTTHVHDLTSRLRCSKCAEVGKRPVAVLLQLQPHPRHTPDD
jgi:hypothetical protein